MCGRYEFALKDDKKGRQIKNKAKEMNLVYKQGEIFPGDEVLCIVPKKDKIDLESKKWGLSSNRQINARIESLRTNPFYSKMLSNRCAVICNGFYEWDPDKRKHYISSDNEYIYLACIYNDNNELLIITRDSYSDFKKIHDRIPIIMNQKEMLEYIHGKDIDIAKKDLKISDLDNDIKLF